MLGGTLTLYFFVLFAGLIIIGADSFGVAEVAAIGAVGALALIVARTWSEMVGPEEDDRDEVADVPAGIRAYLDDHHVRWVQRHHERADTAQHLAHALHVTGHCVAKVVVVRADGNPWMVVLPATERIDFEALRGVLHVGRVEMMPERELARLFPDCEVGAEPPFGRLYRVPTVVEEDLVCTDHIAFHGGLHRESIVVPTYEYERLEQPLIAHVASLPN